MNIPSKVHYASQGTVHPGHQALAGDPAFRKKLEPQLPGDGPASDLPAGFGRFRRGKRGDR